MNTFCFELVLSLIRIKQNFEFLMETLESSYINSFL